MLELGFSVSAAYKSDLVVLGSFLNADTISIFSTKTFAPNVMIVGGCVSIDVPANSADTYYAILPREEGTEKSVKEYRANVMAWREVCSTYIQCPPIMRRDLSNYSVQHFSRDNLSFRTSKGINDQRGETVALAYGSQSERNLGMVTMMKGIKSYAGLLLLSAELRTAVDKLMDKIESAAAPHR